MKRMIHAAAASVLFLVIVIGCDALRSLIVPSTVTVRFVNRAGASVDVSMRYSDIEDITKSLLEVVGTQRESTIAAFDEGDLGPFECEEFRAVMIDDADLNVLGDVDGSTGAFRDGEDFNCGDTLVFTFTSPSAFVLDIAFDSR